MRSAVAQAARQTRTDFDFLLAQARVESGLDADVKAPTSSASGLFQFVESTWLSTLKRHGPQLGYGDVASMIDTSTGRARVADPQMRRQILDLRNDPQAASLMAGALAQDNRTALMPVLGREPDDGELYLAHFLGADGASRFLTALGQTPDAPAAAAFGRAAAANRAIFYQPDGSARSFAGVMDTIRGRMEMAAAQNGAMGGGDLASAWSHAAQFGGYPTASAAGSGVGTLSVPSLGQGPAFRPLSDVLRDNFALADTGSGHAGEHARRAYAKLKAFGL